MTFGPLPPRFDFDRRVDQTVAYDLNWLLDGIAAIPAGPPGPAGATGPAGPPGPAGSGGVPYFIALGDTYTVPVFIQALFEMVIDVQGTLTVDGFLIQVS